MSEHIKKTIDDALEELRKQEAAVKTTKELINKLCEFGKMPIMFTDLGETKEAGPRTAIRRNAFYGQPLSKCVREFLEMRRGGRSEGGEATLDEIMTALKEGNFDLSTISKDEDGQKRGVAITLGKNSATFHKLPNGDFGLLVWYPNVKAKKEKAAETTTTATATTNTEETTEDPVDLTGVSTAP